VTVSAPIYLDHNATTPIDPRVVAAMRPHLEEIFGNPASVEHVHGHAAGLAVEAARRQVAQSIGARESEIIFTGSCTEANNLAIFGVAGAYPEKRRMITTVVEHPAVLEPLRVLEARGWEVVRLSVDNTGCVTPEAVEAALTDDTALVSVMAANNEVGSLQPIAAIGALCAARGVLFHSDVAQLSAYGRLDVERDGIHLASLSAHKAYGPKGVGALYVRSRRPRVKLEPLLFGGGQERGLRPGTLNTAAIVGIGEAFQLAATSAVTDAQRLHGLSARFLDGLRTAIPETLLNGPTAGRLANNLSLSIPGVEPLALMRRLRDRVSLSASSACATDKVATSHVLTAMFGDVARARQAFRVAPGRFTTEADMDQALTWIVEEVRRLREGSLRTVSA
jgi:cysteine desulfurase